MSTSSLLLSLFIFVNSSAFFTMWIDKYRAKKNNKERISEGTLFFLAVMFGSIGVYLGMFVFRHKNHKWHFLLGIPMLILQNSAMLYVVYLFFK